MREIEDAIIKRNPRFNRRDMERSLKLGMEYLTEKERELLTMKVKVGMEAEKLAETLGFGSARKIDAAYHQVISILKIYVDYFAGNSHKLTEEYCQKELADQGKLLASRFAGAETIGVARERIEADLQVMVDSGIPSCQEYAVAIRKLDNYRRL